MNDPKFYEVTSRGNRVAHVREISGEEYAVGTAMPIIGAILLIGAICIGGIFWLAWKIGRGFYRHIRRHPRVYRIPISFVITYVLYSLFGIFGIYLLSAAGIITPRSMGSWQFNAFTSIVFLLIFVPVLWVSFRLTRTPKKS